MKPVSIYRTRLLKLTGQYQRKHPDFKDKIPVPGRIALAKRVEYAKKATRIFLNDRYLHQMLFSSKLEQYEGTKRIARFVMKRCAGNKQKAREYVESLITQLNNSGFTEEEIKSLSALQGISEEKIEEFEGETKHMSGAAMMLALSRLERVRHVLNKQGKI
ncbi:MAG TPA: hypothetical protein VJH23_06570 [archaeon]|nr:hypothetical protein [archaeon]